MDITPEKLFRRMESAAINTRRSEYTEAKFETQKREPVYIPQNTRDGTYRQLMRSHDRMGTRHLQ